MTRFKFETLFGGFFLAAAAAVIFCLQGCAIVGGGNMTIEQKASLLRAGTMTATSVGLGQIKDEDKRNDIAARIVLISTKIVQVLDGGQIDLTGELVGELLNALVPPDNVDVPPEARAAILSALGVLFAQIDVPNPSDLVDADTLTLIRAAIDGIRTGAQVHVKVAVAFFDPSTGGIIMVLPTEAADKIEEGNS